MASESGRTIDHTQLPRGSAISMVTLAGFQVGVLAAPRLEAARGLHEPPHEGRGSISTKTSSRREPPPGAQVQRERNDGSDTCPGLATAARRADQVLADAGEVVKPPMLKDIPQWRDKFRVAEDRLKFTRIAVVVGIDGRQRRSGPSRRIVEPLPATWVGGGTVLHPECSTLLEQLMVVLKVVIDGASLDAGETRNLADIRSCRPDGSVQLKRSLHDPRARTSLALSPLPELVFPTAHYSLRSACNRS